jgi:hypothetical protein
VPASPRPLSGQRWSPTPARRKGALYGQDRERGDLRD